MRTARPASRAARPVSVVRRTLHGRVARVVPIAVLAACLVPGVLGAQSIGAAVVPDTVRVGDVFRVAIRAVLPPGHGATFPDSLDLPDDVEMAGRRALHVDTLPDGGLTVTSVYPLSAWRPGAVELERVEVRIEGPVGAEGVEVALPRVTVASVLPDDAPGLDPRPPKDVLGASRRLWPLLLLALLVGAVAMGGVVYWRSRRERPRPAVAETFAPAPRERTLAQLDEALELGLIEAGEYKAFYSRVTGALRGYLEALDAAWGAELTTTELTARTDAMLEAQAAEALRRLLRAGDMVKFAKREPTRDEARDDWAAARRWVASFDWPPPRSAASEAEADPVSEGEDAGVREPVGTGEGAG